MPVDFKIQSFTLKDGTVVSVPPSGTVILVGPNNVGKSQFLRDIAGLARDGGYVPTTVERVTFQSASASDIEIDAWVDANIPAVNRNGQKRYGVEGWAETDLGTIRGQLANERPGLLATALILHANSIGRLTGGDSQGSVDFSSQPAVLPIQRAYRKPEIERQLAQASRDAFGLDVMVDRYAGSVISLRVGDLVPFQSDERGPKQEYLDALKDVPRLEDQGDGVRSYIGLTLNILAGSHQIMLVDEPEAFLHPPQARLLGRVLAERSSNRQVIIATHSSDIVHGALAGSSDTTIIRFTRDAGGTHAAVLSNTALKEFWGDPILRYSNVLDGLFNDAVVVCEGDADCLYYSAVMENLPPLESAERGSRRPEVLFTWSGGKSRISTIVRALRAVQVPVLAVGDFDVLRTNTPELQRIVEALGRIGEAEKLEPDLIRVRAALDGKVSVLRKIVAKDEFLARLDGIEADTLSKEDVERLRAVLRADSGWDQTKNAGELAVPQGEASAACSRLLKLLASWGLLLVPVGRLERFEPTIPGHGPAWVADVLEQSLHLRPSRQARDFVSGMLDEIRRQVSGVLPR